jgi:hypothetical protein
MMREEEEKREMRPTVEVFEGFNYGGTWPANQKGPF